MVDDIRISGIREYIDGVDITIEDATQAFAAAAFEEMELIITASKAVVPVDVGTLKASAGVNPPEFEGNDRFSILAGYGGAARAYALEQHERLDFKHEEGQQAKYLEEPARNRTDGMAARIRSAIASRLGIPTSGGGE